MSKVSEIEERRETSPSRRRRFVSAVVATLALSAGAGFAIANGSSEPSKASKSVATREAPLTQTELEAIEAQKQYTDKAAALIKRAKKISKEKLSSAGLDVNYEVDSNDKIIAATITDLTKEGSEHDPYGLTSIDISYFEENGQQGKLEYSVFRNAGAADSVVYFGDIGDVSGRVGGQRYGLGFDTTDAQAGRFLDQSRATADLTLQHFIEKVAALES